MAGTLCQGATIGELRALLEHDWISHRELYDYVVSDEQIGDHVDVLRATAPRRLSQLLDTFAASLADREVSQFPFDRTADGTDREHTVDAYVTGGVTPSDAPTESFEAWDVVYATEKPASAKPTAQGGTRRALEQGSTAELVTELRRRAGGHQPRSCITSYLQPGDPFGRDRLNADQHGVRLGPDGDITIVDTAAGLKSPRTHADRHVHQ